MTINVISSVIIISFIAISVAHADTQNTQNDKPKRITTLWSDKQECITEDAFMIAIEEYGNTYKVAACAPAGCRISVPEFGKRTHHLNYRHDPKFIWITDTVFEVTIYDKNTRFYKCNF